MQYIFEILKKNSKYKTITKDLERGIVIKKNWEGLFGKLASELKYGYLKKGLLVIESRNQMWVNEIDFYKNDLLKKINSLFARKVVYNLKIVFGFSADEVFTPTTKVKNTSISLHEKVLKKIQLKRKAGYKVCKVCKINLTSNEICVLCKIKTNRPIK